MFIRTARNHQPAALFLIPLLAIVLWLPGLISPSPPAPEVHMPLYAAIDVFLRAHPFTAVLLGMLFATGEAFLLNYVLRAHQVVTSRTWLPALLFVVFSACTPGLLWLHPQLIAGAFILLALHDLLGTFRLEKATGEMFRAGFFIGLAGMFYLPSVFFLLFSIAAIMVLRPFTWREWMVLIIGTCTPFLYAGVYFLWHNQLNGLTETYIVKPILHRDFFLALPAAAYPLTAVTALLLIAASGNLITGRGTSTLKTRKGVSVMNLFLFFAVLTIIPAQNFSSSAFLFMAYPIAFFISGFFLSAKRLWIAETLFFLLLLSIAASYAIDRGLLH